GWSAPTEITALELAKRFEDAGVAAILHTDLERDGVKTGLNLDATAELARAVSVPVIASGGLSGIEDIRRLLTPEYSCIAGAIAGRSLYDGALDPKEALALIAAAEQENG
ncbi:MAG: HisA/HisF-related TIM barrel protein, partial [Alphaproteobacteria bacterium]